MNGKEIVTIEWIESFPIPFVYTFFNSVRIPAKESSICYMLYCTYNIVWGSYKYWLDEYHNMQLPLLHWYLRKEERSSQLPNSFSLLI